MKVCSVTPQVTNGTGLVDSKLFDAIKSSSTLTGIELRNMTKGVYNAYKATEFTHIFGEHNLYRKVVAGVANKLEMARFATVYNNNVELLHNSINIKLDVNGEPLLLSKVGNSILNTMDKSLLDNKRIIIFDNAKSIEDMASRLNTTTDILIDNILSTNNIQLLDTNAFMISNLLTPNVEHSIDTLGYKFNIQVTSPHDSLKLNETSLSDLVESFDVRDIDDLSLSYTTNEITEVGKIVGALLTENLDEFNTLIKSLEKGGIVNYDQNIKIKKFITTKLNESKKSILQEYADLEKLTTDPTEKERITNRFMTIKTSYEQLINVINHEDTDGEFSFVYRGILAILSKEYNININYKKTTTEVVDEDVDGADITIEVNAASWDGRGALGEQQQFNLSRELKDLLTKSITRNISDVHNNMNTQSKYGISTPITVSDVWNVMMNVSANNDSREGIIRSLRDVNHYDFNGALTEFINKIESDDALWDSYYTGAVKAMFNVNRINIKSSNDNTRTVISTKTVNYMANPKSVAREALMATLTLQVDHSNDKSEQTTLGAYKTDSSAEGLSKFNSKEKSNDVTKFIENTFNKNKFTDAESLRFIIKANIITLQLNKVITIQDIDRYVALVSKSNPFEVGTPLFDVQGANTFSSLAKDDAFRKEAITEYTKIATALVRMNIDSQRIRLDKGLKISSFRNMFNENTSLDYFSNVASIKQYRNTSLGYFNANGDAEQTPQKPSFLSDFAKIFNSLDGNLNEDLLKEHFKEYLEDESMQYNSFLYNKFGNGIFNKSIVNGSETITLNSNFINNFKLAMLDGVHYDDTNTGAKYDEITGDSWTILKITDALKGVYGIPSSDTGRHYTITNSKYGLKGFVFENDGKYSSRLNLIRELGIENDINYIPGRESIASRRIDLTDPNFKVAVPAGDGNYKIMTLTQLRDTSVLDTELTSRLSTSLGKHIDYFNIQIESLAKRISRNKDTKYAGEPNYEFIKNYTGKKTNIGAAYINAFGSDILKSSIVNKEALSNEDIKQAIVDLYKLVNPKTPSTFIEFSKKPFDIKDADNNNSLFNQLDFFNAYLGVNPFKEITDINNTIASQKEYNSNPSLIIKSDQALLNSYSQFRNSVTIQSLKNTVETERFVMAKFIDKMFNFEHMNVPYAEDNTKELLVTKGLSLKAGIKQMENEGRLSSPMLHNGKGIISNGKASGKVFQFNRMTYTEKDANNNNKLITLQDFIASKIHNGQGTPVDVLELIARTDINTNPKRETFNQYELRKDTEFATNLFNKYTYEFIDNWLASKQNKAIEKSSPFIDELHTTLVDGIPPYVAGTSNLTKRSNRTANLFSMEDETARIVDKETLKTLKEQGISSKEARYSQESIIRSANKSLLEATVNSYLSHINIGEDILFGRSFEYKGIKDINKRVNEIIKNGGSNDSDYQIRSMTISDIETVTNMTNLLNSNNGIDETFLQEHYLKPVEVGNGLSMITVDEFINRLKATNDYEKFAPYINALTDPNTPYNPGEYAYIAEQLKYYLYNRKSSTNGLTAGMMISYQEKNSTIVLFPKLFKGTTYEGIVNWMNERKFGELNFFSASKVGDQPIFTMHNTYNEVILGKLVPTHYDVPLVTRDGVIYFDDRLDKTKEDFSPNNRVNIEEYIVTHKLKNLRIQQDTVGHLKDEEGVLASQQVKKIFTNMLDSEIYNINGKPYQGRTNNYADGKRGLFENFHLALSTNAQTSMTELIGHWEGLDEYGNIKYNMEGYIDFNHNIIESEITDYFTTSADVSTMRALDVKGGNKFSLHNPSIRAKVEELLQSKITKNAAIKLKQIHAPIMPDVFMQPTSFAYGKDKVVTNANIQQLLDNSMISLSKEFLNRVGTNDFELQSEYTDAKGKFHPAEIITNVWDSKFDKYRTIINGMPHIDIDAIPEDARTMVGTRIPHEGMQSSFVAIVVGFMNTDASQIIVPKHLSIRTGWDYDIDTVYLYPKALHEINGELHPISYDNNTYDTKESKQSNVFKLYFGKTYNGLKNTKNYQIRKAIDAYKADVTQLSSQLDKVAATNEDKKLIRINGKYIIEAVEATKNNLLLSDDKSNIEFESDVTNIHNVSTNLRYANLSNEQLTKLDELKNERLQELKDAIQTAKNQYNLDYDEFTKSDNFVAKYNSLSNIQLVSKETRDNMLVDTLMARISHTESTRFREQPNEFVQLNNVSSWINKIYGMDDNMSNFTDMFDRSDIENMNRDVRKLKGVSVSLDNNYAVLGSIGAGTTEKMAIPYVIERHEFTHATDKEIMDSLDEVIGLKDVQVFREDGKISKVIVFSTKFGNNKNKTWTNVNGNRISKFSSQITANVLDAVKENLAININTNTIGILTMLANSPVSHNTEIGNKGVKQDSAFTYSNLILHQAIVSKVLSEMNKSSRGGEFSDKNKAIRSVKQDTYSKIISTLNNITIATREDGSSISPLIVYYRHLNNKYEINKQDVANEAKLKEFDKWITSIENGEELKFYADSLVNPIELFNEVSDFISGRLNTTENGKALSLDDYMLDYLTESEYNNKSNNTTFNLPKAFTSGIFTHSEKKGYVVTNPNAFKTINELAKSYENSMHNNDYDINAKFKSLQGITDASIQTNFLNFLVDQLGVLDLYEHIDKTAGLISRASSPLSTDKKGTSPSGEVTSKLMNNMADMHLDIQAFLENMKAVGYSLGDVNNFRNEYYQLSTVTEKSDLMNAEILAFNDPTKDYYAKKGIKLNTENIFTKDLTMHLVSLNVGEKTLIESIFPYFVKDYVESQEEDGTIIRTPIDFDVTKSSYPFFEAQFNYLNKFSTKAFGGILLSEHRNIKPLLDAIMVDLNLSNNLGDRKRSKYRNKLLTSLTNRYVVQVMPFFNGGGGITGTLTQKTLREEIQRVLGNPIQVIVQKELNGEMINVEDIEDGVIPMVFDFKTFKERSAANKVSIIKGYLQQGSLKGVNIDEKTRTDIQRLLSYVEPRITKNDIKQYGYHSIKVNSTEEDANQLKQTFTKMYYSENPFIRETARDLIRYSFHTSGLQYGANISKWIEPSLLHEDNSRIYNLSESLIKELSLPENQLYTYNQHVKEVPTAYNSYDLTSILEDLRAQMYDDNAITPLVYVSKGINQPQFNTSLEHTINGVTTRHPIIVESKSKIANSKYNNNNSLRIKLNLEKYSGTYAMMKYEPEDSTNVYYFPFKKQLGNVFTEDVLDIHIQKLMPIEIYKSIIEDYDVAHKEQTDVRSIEDIYPTERVLSNDARITGNLDNYQYFNNITKSNKSYSETAKDIISKVDHVIVIGNNQHYINSFASNKTINTSLNDFSYKTVKDLLFNKPTTLAIVGDVLSDNNNTQEEYDKVIIPTIRYIMEAYNITGIKTIYKKGVGESIFKATFNNNASNEYIEVGMKDSVHDIRAIDDTLIAPFIVTSTKETFQNIDRLVSNFATNIRLKEFVRGFENSHADTFDFNLQSTRNTISKINDKENTFKGIIEALAKNFDAVDKAIEFFNAEGMDTMIDGKLEHINMLHSDFNIYKYLNGRDTDFKIKIAKRLNLYQNIIHVANEIMKLDVINPPSINTAEFKLLPQEEQDYIKDKKNEIDLYNETLLKYKSSMFNMPYSGKPESFTGANAVENLSLTREGKVKQLTQRIEAKIQEFHGANLYIHTRNPKYANSLFTKLIQKILGDTLISDPNVDPKAEDLVHIYAQAVKYNDDLGFMQLNIDSVRNTGIAIIDVSMKLFEEFNINAKAKQSETLGKLSELFGTIGIVAKNSKDNIFDYNATRGRDFKKKYINPKTGYLITDYDNIKLNRDLRDHRYNKNRMEDLHTILNTKSIVYDSQILTNFATGNNILNPATSKINIYTTIFSLYKNLQKASNLKTFYSNSIKTATGVTKPIIILKSNGKDITISANLTNSGSITPDFFNNITISDGNESFSYADLVNNVNSPYAKNKLAYDANPKQFIAYLQDIGKNTPQYDRYLNDFITKDLADDTIARRDYEQKFHIQFQLTNVGREYSGESRYSSGLETMEYKAKHGGESIAITKQTQGIGNVNLNISYVIPSDIYKNEAYFKLTTKEQLFIKGVRDTMQEIMNDVFPNKTLAEDVIPYIFLSSTTSLGKAFLNLVGYQAIQEEHVGQDVLGNTKHYFQVDSLQKPNIKTLMNTPPKLIDESHYEYEERVVAKANEKLTRLKAKNKGITFPAFETYADVIKYNDAVMDEFMKKSYEDLNHDLPSVMKHFAEEMYHMKTRIDYENVYSLLLNTVGSDGFEARVSRADGKYMRDKIYNMITRDTNNKSTTDYVTAKGKETAAFTRLKAFEPLLTGQSRVNTVADQMIKMTLKYVSLNTMGLNYHTWAKNVYQGISTNTIAAAGGELINMKEYGRAMNEYMSSITATIAGVGHDTTNNRTVAVMKYFEDIFTDHTEGELVKQTGGKFAKASNFSDTLMYSGMTGGEHAIQMTNLLAFMDSHRVVPVEVNGKKEGVIMSRAEYINNRKLKVITPLLTDEQNAKLKEYIDIQSKNENNLYNKRDIFSYWIRMKSGITDAQSKSIRKALTEERDKALVEFEGKKNVTGKLKIGGFPNVKSLITLDTDKYKLDDKGNQLLDDKGLPIANHNFGKAKLSDKLSQQQVAVFSSRVRAFNQSLHGVYNTLDRSRLQNDIKFEVAFQFRKYIYPVWIRYMGQNFSLDIRKHDRVAQFNEDLGYNKEGIFQTFFNFLKTPYIKGMLEAQDAHVKYPAVIAFANMFKYMGNALENMKLEYNMMDEHQRNNMRSFAQFTLNTLVISVALFFIGGPGDSDEDKKKFSMVRNGFINDIAGLQSEHLDLIPFYGWVTFYGRAKKNPFPLEKTIGDLSKLVWDMGMYSFRSEADRKYKSGVYAHKSRIEIDLEKAIPGYRQWHKEQYMQQNIAYYKMASPIFNIMSSIK